MGKIVLYMQISLDGIVSDVEQWMSWNDEILEDALEYYDSLDAIVVGGNTYASMAEYWQRAETSSESVLERAFAKRINELRKIVISRSELELVWKNSQQLLYKENDSFVREMDRLKTETAKQISVESGVRTWQLFLHNALFDELRLLVHPVLAANGDRLFADLGTKYTLELLGTKVYPNGVVEMHYQKNECSRAWE